MQARQADLGQGPVQQPVMGQNQPPRINPRQIAGPERHHHRRHHHRAQTRAGQADHRIGHRPGEDDVRDRYRRGDADRAQRDVDIDRAGEKLLEIGEGEAGDQIAAEIVNRPEGGDEQRPDGRQIQSREPDGRQPQQSRIGQARPPPAEGGERLHGVIPLPVQGDADPLDPLQRVTDPLIPSIRVPRAEPLAGGIGGQSPPMIARDIIP